MLNDDNRDAINTIIVCKNSNTLATKLTINLYNTV